MSDPPRELDGIFRYADSYEWMERIRQGLPPLIITCAVNGGLQGKEANPILPETPEEIAQQAKQAYDAGASMVHVHARAPENLAEAGQRPEIYREINAAIRELCPDVVINNTSGGGLSTTMEERFACLDVRPEIASLNMGPEMLRLKVAARSEPLSNPHPEYVFDGTIAWTYRIICDLAGAMKERGIKPEMELYQGGQYWVFSELKREGLVEPPYLFQFVMGYQTSTYPTPANLCDLVRELPDQSIFFTCGIGQFQLPMTSLSIILGGHVRVGLEDNVYLRRGQKLSGNGEVVERVVRIARELNREIATPAQARTMLGLGAVPSPAYA